MPQLPPCINRVLILELNDRKPAESDVKQKPIRLAPAAAGGVVKLQPRIRDIQRRKALKKVRVTFSLIPNPLGLSTADAFAMYKRRLCIQESRMANPLRGVEIVGFRYRRVG